MAHTGNNVLPNVTPFSGKSEAEGSALGNIGVSQELCILGRPATMGMGLMASAGAGLSFRDVPASNGTSVSLAILNIGSFAAVQVTDRLDAGCGLILGSSTLDAPFQGIGSAALAYSLRGTMGVNYDVGCGTSVGVAYMTPQNFNYDDAIRLQLPAGGFTAIQDVDAGLPDNLLFGVANDRLFGGRLLLAMDVLFKQWENADLFRAIYKNQWVFQLGAQYEVGPRIRLRGGYVFAENPIDPNVGISAGGVVPPPPVARAQAAIEYLQATVAVINQHRVSCGVGIQDVLPGVDLDLYAGGMFRDSQNFGPLTWASVQSYWVGGGLTWEFGAGPCEDS
jgi:long-chain fatty acid transport protein